MDKIELTAYHPRVFILESELERLQIEANKCVTEYGHVRSEYREEYNILCSKMEKIREYIMLMEGRYYEKH